MIPESEAPNIFDLELGLHWEILLAECNCPSHGLRPVASPSPDKPSIDSGTFGRCGCLYVQQPPDNRSIQMWLLKESKRDELSKHCG